MANSQEEAWEKMAARFPQETSEGFTVHEWKNFDVKVAEGQRDERNSERR